MPITGPIPQEICGLRQLRKLLFIDCELTGTADHIVSRRTKTLSRDGLIFVVVQVPSRKTLASCLLWPSSPWKKICWLVTLFKYNVVSSQWYLFHFVCQSVTITLNEGPIPTSLGSLRFLTAVLLQNNLLTGVFSSVCRCLRHIFVKSLFWSLYS